MGAPAKKCRCPVCNRFGSASLNGYCKDHVPNEVYEEGRFYIKRDNPMPVNGFHHGDFVDTNGYGCVSEGYGYER